MLAVLALLVSGCGSDVRRPENPAAGGIHPVVTPRQAVQILGAVDASLVRAAAARDIGQAGGRVIGPERQVLAASYVILNRLKQTATAPPAPTKPRLLLPVAETWPRWFLVAGSSPKAPTPVLRVLTCDSARVPYGLWSDLNLLPGATLPEVASATTGAPRLTPTATGLSQPPATVLAQYTDLLNRGDASAYRDSFAADSFRTQLNDQLKVDRAAFATKGVGTVIAVHNLGTDPVLTLGTADGGALVIGRVDQKYTVTVAAGKGSVRLEQQLAALAGVQTVTKRLDVTAVQTLAFFVPKAGSTAKIGLIAASKSDVAAVGS